MSTVHFDQIAHLLGVLALLLLGARMAGHAVSRLGFPSVLGELALGMVLGSRLLTSREEEWIVWRFLGELGVLLLLFEVGLESRLGELRKVGAQSFRVAVLGVVFPMIFGILVSNWSGVMKNTMGHLFLGAALSATSVGLTARVFREFGAHQSKEAKIILGAAVMDDVLGLVILAIVTALAKVPSVSDLDFSFLFFIIFKAMSFIVTAVVFGLFVLPWIFHWTSGVLGKGATLTTGIAVCLLYSWAAHQFGLAPAVGAFFAGLMMQPETYAPLRGAEEGLLEKHLESMSLVFVPLFFVLTGMQVDLRALADTSTLAFTMALIFVAVMGKVLAGCSAGSNVRRLVVGVGMVPRGEVGLIFAALGAGIVVDGQALLSPAAFAAVVTTVAASTFIAPLWLGVLLKGGRNM